MYEQRLKLLEYADAAGFYCYHLAEHHLTPLGGAPSPGLFLAAATQRTRQLRLGALVYILPLYHPIRLAEEICMLDHLSRGRLVVGTGRGASPHELAGFGVAYDEAQSSYDEVFDLLRRALTSNMTATNGRRYSLPPIDVSIRPFQQPYPPFWYPAGRPETIRHLGQQAINTVTFGGRLHAIREVRDIYFEALEQNRNDPARLNAHEPDPKFGLVRQLYIAESQAQAEREARIAYQQHRACFTYLWERLGGDERFRPESDFDTAIDHARLIVGTPELVRERVQEHLEVSSANYFVANFSFGDMTDEQVMRSMGLFTEQIRPSLKRAVS
jgi:alkanesulfonate monooxygenase SsuD/methylene tetrahydromethanopterin reductase-like flavin-dependent oxidoreductase (luciferase family)